MFSRKIKKFSDEEELQRAIRNGNTKIVRKLIKEGVNFNWRNSKGDTLLDVTAQTDNVGIIKLLLSAKAKTGTRGTSKYAFLSCALKNYNMAMTKILVETSHSVHKKYGMFK